VRTSLDLTGAARLPECRSDAGTRPEPAKGPPPGTPGSGGPASGASQLHGVAEVARLPPRPARKSGDFRYTKLTSALTIPLLGGRGGRGFFALGGLLFFLGLLGLLDHHLDDLDLGQPVGAAALLPALLVLQDLDPLAPLEDVAGPLQGVFATQTF